MSGSLSSIIDRIGRVADSRAEARVKAALRRVSAGLEPAVVRYQPPVRDFGDFRHARAILKGELQLGGYRAPLHDLTPWELDLRDPTLAGALHGYGWLDDLSSLGTRPARERAQGWVLGWLDRFAEGAGPGWTAEAAAGRLLRLLTHLPFLDKDFSDENRGRVRTALALHAAYLDDGTAVPHSLAGRIEVLSARLHAAQGFGDMAGGGASALAALDALCAEDINDNGAILSRNPEELLTVFRNLLWLRDLCAETGAQPSAAHGEAIARIAPALRALRLGDGSLARFHGGGRGADGALDAALADSGVRRRPSDVPAMGYARLSGARTVVVVDVARPPKDSDNAHASTLALEMSSGRRKVLVNTGPALSWLADWARLPRTTAAHNTLSLDKTSSSRFGPARASGKPGQDGLLTRPAMVTLTRARDGTGCWMQARHDGYLEDYGLLHERRLFVTADGRELHGEDVLLSPDQKAQRRFQSRIKGAAQLGVALNLNFHIHPDVTVVIDRAKDQVHLTLSSGEVWLFRHSGGLLDVEPSAYVADPLSAPRVARQIVLRNRATRHEANFGWSLVREDTAAQAVRDLAIDAPGRTGQ